MNAETEASIGRAYHEALMKAMRDTKLNLTRALESGWTGEQFRHWVETGEVPT